MTDNLYLPPSLKDLNELEIFLRSECAPQDGMSLEAADGLMCAAIVGPKLIAPSEWLGVIFGDGVFDSQEMAHRVTGTLLRRFNQVVRQVETDVDHKPSQYKPIIAEIEEENLAEDEDSNYGYDWSRGFLYGMSCNLEAWTELGEDQEFSAIMTPIMLLNTGTQRLVLDQEITHNSRKDLVRLIPQSVQFLWKYWEPKRRQEAKNFASKHAESSPKINRDDPCPCGSGRKYEKCCLH